MRTFTFLTIAIASIFINAAYATRAELNKRLGEGLVPDLSGATGAAGGPLTVVTSALDSVTGGTQPKEKRGLLGGVGGGSGGLPLLGGGSGGGLLGGLLGGGKSRGKNKGAGKGKGRRRDRRAQEYSKQPEAKLASSTTTKSGLPIVGNLGVLRKRSSVKILKRETGFPETAAIMGKTMFDFDAADKVVKDADSATKAVSL